MSQDEKISQLFEKIVEIGERATRIETKLETIERDVSDIKKEDAEQNILLAEHIAGVNTNRERLNLEKQERERTLAEHAKRIETLESLPKFLTFFKKILLYLAAIAGAVMTLAKFLAL